LSSDSDTPFVIRDARSDDCGTIVEFNRRLALETESKILDLAVLQRGVERALADRERLRYWVAEAGDPGAIVGQAAATREWSDWRNGWVWWLQSVYVSLEWRGKGVFRALYERIREDAQTSPDVIGLRLYVEEANLAAQKTYRSLGMKPGGYLVYEELWLSTR
jgi:GNAT superfamily N-acetyltransferase